MNLLEHYIKEIHSEEPYEEEWTKEFPDTTFIEADITYECYGRIERKKHIWNIHTWNRIKDHGYFMG